MTKASAATTRQIARCERAAVILERYHDELRALPVSARTTRLIRANRTAIARLQEQSTKARERMTSAVAARAAS